jgi:hypothetical protein
MRVTKGSFWDFLLQDLGMKPTYKEPEKPQADFYGGDGTIHQTGHVDVQLNKDGDVVAVWFRCRMLPFEQSTKYTVDSLPQQGHGSIKGIVFEE